MERIILWFASLMLMWTGLKFVFMLFKRISNKNTINGLLDKAENGLENAADKTAVYLNQKKQERKNRKEERQKEKNKDEAAIVIIR